MVEIKRFSAKLNKDDKEGQVLPFEHIGATNGRFVGGANGFDFLNVKGNRLISNPSLPIGTNECLGRFHDDTGKRIIYFNWNSNGNHGIYQISVQTDLITPIFICGTNSASDIFHFDRDYPICSAWIIYRPQGDGDLLYWTDALNRPRFLNLDTVAALQPFTEPMINAAKDSPLVPPIVSYASVSAFNANNVHNQYIRIAYRYGYSDFLKSTFSPTSELAIPDSIIFPNADTASNINNAINVTIPSGSTKDFQTIEVFAQIYNGTTWGDFFLINTVNKADIVTPIPFSFNYNFLNNGTYSPLTEGIGEGENFQPISDLLFSWLPDKANALIPLNGDTLMMSGITEGYDNLTRQQVNFQITSSLYNANDPKVQPTFPWAAYQRWGILYKDARGKSPGVISYLADTNIDANNFDFTTPQYVSANSSIFAQIPKVNVTLNHAWPSWAESMVFVREYLVPKMVQYVTNDYQADNEYIYLGIQALINANNNNGFIPSYDFVDGDHVKIMARYDSNYTSTAYSTQLDFQILGIVERTMQNGNPAVTGSFLKLRKPNTFPTPVYSANMFIQIYTPVKALDDKSAVFYEFGQSFGYQTISGVKYHIGNVQNQTASLPALYEFKKGQIYVKTRQVYRTTNETSVIYLMQMDANYNDFQQSAANSDSRGWPIDINAREQYFPATSRWGKQFVQDTNINQLNIFWPQNLDTADRSKGDIRTTISRGREAIIYQERGVGRYGVYSRYISNSEGEPQLITTNDIITTNNIQYYKGFFGIGKYPTNLVSTPQSDYFLDIVTGHLIRHSLGGLDDLGELDKGQYFFADWVTPYNKQITRTNGSIAKVMGFLDYFNNEYHALLEAGTGGGVTVPYRNFSFNDDEKRRAFCCDNYNYQPERAICVNNVIYSWVGGQVWKHDSDTYCNFYGTQYDCDITVVFNKDLVEKKTFQSLSENSNGIKWDCPTMYTNSFSYGTTKQRSHLVEANFTSLESMATSSIMRDENSQGGWVNGNYMKGNYMVVKFRKQSASDLVVLSEVIMYYTDSAFTNK